MNNSKSYINIELSKRLREQFKDKCKRQGITMQKAVPMLMKKVVDGEMGFKKRETKLVLNEK